MTANDTDGGKSTDCIDHTDPETLRRLYWDEGKSLSQIAERTPVTIGAIKHHMEKHGIDRRTNAEANRRHTAAIRVGQYGYVRWHSTEAGRERTCSVHRLLAVSEFGIDAVKDMDVHHKNGIPWDNRAENIELLTTAEHASHHSSGEKHHDAKLTKRDVAEIDRLLSDGSLTGVDIANRYGVGKAQISAIKTGRNWGHFTGR